MPLFGPKPRFVYDLAIVGGGSAAFAAAIRAAELGARVVVIESGLMGGTCVNRGCVPTKNLLHAAERYHLYQSDGFPGIPGGNEPADFAALIRQKDELVNTMREARYENVLAAHPSVTYVSGRAVFRSPHEIEVGERALSAEKSIVATGAASAVPPIEGLPESGYLTYKEALELERLPGSLVVIGGGAIGLELGQMFARLGSRVDILEMLPHIAAGEEPPISDALAGYLASEGIGIHTGAQVVRVKKDPMGLVVEAQVGHMPREFRGERLLVAAGLRPNTQDLGLAAAGVDVDSKGAVRVDATLRSSAPNIWAAGDVLGSKMLVTTAAVQGGLAAENALRKAAKKFDGEAVPHAIFTDPQVASVGLSEAAARAGGHKVEIASIPFDLVPKAGAIRDTRGLLRLVVDRKSFRILGVHLVSPAAADLIHIGVLAIRHKLTVGDLVRTTFVYPTLAEAFKIAALSFQKDVTRLSCCAQ
jgi:mercuric reductase